MWKTNMSSKLHSNEFVYCNLGKQEIAIILALKQILHKEYKLVRGELNGRKMEQRLSSGEPRQDSIPG